MASAVVASAVVASAVVLSGMFVIRSQPSAALFGTSCRFSQARSTFHGYDTIVAWPRRRTKVRDCKVQSPSYLTRMVEVSTKMGRWRNPPPTKRSDQQKSKVASNVNSGSTNFWILRMVTVQIGTPHIQ